MLGIDVYKDAWESYRKSIARLIIAVVLSTVYTRHHYAVDVLAGVVWAIALQTTEYPESPLALVRVNGAEVRAETFARGSGPTIASDGRGSLLAAWTEIEPGTDAQRIRVRALRRPGR